MNRLLKSQEYLMKCLRIVLLLGFISFGAIGGCHNDGDQLSQVIQALTENDFSDDPGLSADPTGGVVVMFLEPPDTEKPEKDTEEVGKDRIPYTYTRTLDHTFCWEDDDGDAEHFMELVDSEGNEILKIDVNGECVTEVIEAGDYVMIIHHDGRIEETFPVFIIPEPNGDLAAKKEKTMPQGVVERAGRILSNILEKLDISIIQTTNAQSKTDLNTLLSTNSCVDCDLQRALLFQVNLTEANLSRANLTDADLTDAILLDGILLGVNLTDADLTGTAWCDGSICIAGAGSTGICETGARFMDNCDGTISDVDAGLMWEKKMGTINSEDVDEVICGNTNKCPTPHDVNNNYNWSRDGNGNFDGTVITVFLKQLNDVDGSGKNCFASHCDWRLPEREELRTILDCEFSHCIDPIFGPTIPDLYWSATSSDSSFAWVVDYNGGAAGELRKVEAESLRAVRSIP